MQAFDKAHCYCVVCAISSERKEATLINQENEILRINAKKKHTTQEGRMHQMKQLLQISFFVVE